MVAATEAYYADNNAYPTAAVWPTATGAGKYLKNTPVMVTTASAAPATSASGAYFVYIPNSDPTAASPTTPTSYVLIGYKASYPAGGPATYANIDWTANPPKEVGGPSSTDEIAGCNSWS